MSLFFMQVETFVDRPEIDSLEAVPRNAIVSKYVSLVNANRFVSISGTVVMLSDYMLNLHAAKYKHVSRARPC